MALTCPWKNYRRKHILSLGACVAVSVVLLLLNWLDMFASRQPSHHYLAAHPAVRKDARQPIWLDGVRRDGLTHGLADADLEKMSEDQLFLALHSYLDNIDVICHRKLRMGHVGEGGWEVCDDPDVRPTPPCTVYSYGINNDWSFDDDISQLYGCHVFSFDPSINQGTHNRSRRIHFYKLGISGWRTPNKNWKLYSHQELRALLGHKKVDVDVIKMDVENAEWGALDDMIKADQFTGVKQLLKLDEQ